MCDPATPLDSSSDSTCSCCTSVPESGYPPAPAIQEISTLVGLEGRFLARLKFQSITPFYVQAMAIVPTDPRTAGNWPLIQLLSHRIFSTLQDQRRLRRLSMFCYEHFGPGDVLLIAARPVTQNALKWLEADITRDGALVATVKALFDGRSVEDGGVGSGSSSDLVSSFDKLTTTPSDI